jgi:hypothetical protein
MQTIGARARETARIAYGMLEDNGNGSSAPADNVGALIAAESDAASPAAAPTDSAATGSVTISN